ncbi:hypothetical protein AZI86_16940 [Bdellovibrio bacteriovorus]|uniref:YtkA-like domain-containing protein n=1 Tax=Bdellovibrio bacteriovorus TaxID=959 RepID=A0A150WEL4_BDEBC|nr:hypothetical protein [Bdellovibrio bacteriovorus]KYG61400.1 hypothetical protein AZI86_16940 [Bdellovibrio bacteriovorus]
MKKWIISFIMLAGSLTFAHGDHEHESAASSRPMKGGIVQRIEEAHVEIVAKGKNIKIYLLDLKSEKPQSLKFEDFTLAAKAELPRGKGTSNLTLEPKDGYLEANFDAKGAHRYNLILSLVHKPTKHSDTLTFVIEPKK